MHSMFLFLYYFQTNTAICSNKRGDTGEWALPGGMVDPGEKVTSTAVREFQEEAINSLVMSEGKLFYSIKCTNLDNLEITFYSMRQKIHKRK